MSYNQSRVEKNDGQLRRSGGRSGQNRGFSSGGGGKGGGGGKSGGGGGAGHPPSSSSVNQASLSGNQSFKKSGNGQGGQPRINPASLGFETSAVTAIPRAVQNGAQGQPSSQGASIVPMPRGPKPGETTVPRTSQPPPKSPMPQSSSGISETLAPNTPVKGDGTKPFALQFGTISPGIVNGLQIPARTSSAPPNLDEQKRDQARHESFRAVPTKPIPSGPMQQPQPASKDAVAVNQSVSGDSHRHGQVKREIHQHMSTVPLASQPKSAAIPVPGISMPMTFQQQPIPLQFGAPGPQQMPMTLPTPQIPQQMFVHNLQSHTLQPQAMIHQGQGLAFGPQISHQFGTQLGNLGIGMSPPQFTQQRQHQHQQHQQQQQQQQLQLPGKFAGPRKTAAVKITHPETHEELKLDKTMDSFADGVSLGQRPPNNATLQSQPIASYASTHFFHPLPPNSYNGSPVFFPTSTSVNAGVQPPRFSYPGGQGISFVNPLSLVTASSGPTHGSVKPTAVQIGPKVGSSVTISMPASKAEELKLAKPPVEVHVVPQQKSSEDATKSSFLQPETFAQPQGTTPLPTCVVSTQAEVPDMSSVPETFAQPQGTTPLPACVVSTQAAVPDMLSVPAIHSVDSRSAVSDSRRKESIKISDSLKDNEKKINKKDPRPAQQHQQFDEPAVRISKNDSFQDGNRQSTKEYSITTDARTGEVVENKAIPAVPNTSGVSVKGVAPQDIEMSCSNLAEVATTGGIATEEKGLLKASSSSGPEMDENSSSGLDPSVCRTDNTSLEVDCRKNISEEPEHGKSDVSVGSILDASNAKVHPVPTTAESSDTAKPTMVVKQEGSPMNDSDRQAPTSVESTISACNDKDMPSSPHAIKNELEATCCHDDGSSVSGLSHPGKVAVEAPIISEVTNKSEACVTEVHKDDLTASGTSGPKDKVPSESVKTKPISGKKKKRREILSKADAAGTSDLYNAYKGPEEKLRHANPPESLDGSTVVDEKTANADNHDKDVVTVEEDGQSKTEVDDWEDAADVSTPKLENGNQVNGDGTEAAGPKKYTRDFLLTFSEECNDLPVSFEIGSDVADALMSVPSSNSRVVDRDPYSSTGRITPDRSPGSSRGDRRGMGLMDDDRWTKSPVSGGQNFRPGQGVNYGVLKNPRGQPLNQFYPIFSGPMQSMIPQGGLVRNNSEADRWRSLNNSRGLMPPPQTPLQVMHKAEKKYEVGKVSDEEQAKQRQLKGILNKLTPQNFEKLFQQIGDVKIDNTTTLSGVIAQIFDKALTEPTFCEMYANFCFHLSGVLPDFTENNEKVTFKRLLLNKCQEEFERGEREQAEADQVEEEGGIKQSDEEREVKRTKARRRMLGNIRLIGELYKKKMLTERIMHECIQKLLGQRENPDEEDLEALCKLMSTIGDQIDHGTAKAYMNSYFEGIMKLSTNQKLSSRVRFMLRDVIDLRKNRWQQRRKVEGPKKIEEVHRDAAQERQTQASRLTRGPSMSSNSRRGPPGDYGSRGSSVLPSPNSQISGLRGLPTQARGYGMQDARLDDYHPPENRTLSLPLTQRPIDDSSITLGPQGGLARGMSIRGQPPISSVPLAENPLVIGDSRRVTSGPNGYNATNDRMPQRSRGDVNLGNMPDRSYDTSFDQPMFQDRDVPVGNRESRVANFSNDRFSPTTFPAGRNLGSLGGNLSVASDAKPLSEEVLREKSISTIREFYSAKDEGEVALCIKELNSPSFYPSMVSLWVTDSFERKDMERNLLATLLVNLAKSQDNLFNQLQLAQGFESVLASLEDAVNDAPRAAEFLGRIFVKVILEDVVPLSEVGKLIYEGGEESGSLVESGLASEVLGSILEIIKIDKGDSTVKEMISSSRLRLEDFKPPHPIKSRKLDAFL